ncbi:hypothetical protein HMPREF0813_01257 [Streptococcus anginosus F0211]|uniref:Uncharacterized protein n=1 Tax=Streptococcus anginosus F0211 TaxID=706437 RepID=E6J1W9_STRAP|nr:hypothetical protein HMPREF0813_01257 [Streptococcus anginosus F0211]
MVPKQTNYHQFLVFCFRAVLFRMVPKHCDTESKCRLCFRAVLFRMVPKLVRKG